MLTSILLLGGCSKAKVSSAKIEWIHPNLKVTKIDNIADQATASRLFRLFDKIDRKQEGTPWDTPFYDAVITFFMSDGRSYQAKVYLPREKIFSGMWKHPDGVLMYFEAENGQSSELVELLGPLLPSEPVYPRTVYTVPNIPFDRGIPNFTKSALPIKGDFTR
ncbi:hypothetical protein OH491_11510 [Termitidicoccus mucosus]